MRPATESVAANVDHRSEFTPAPPTVTVDVPRSATLSADGKVVFKLNNERADRGVATVSVSVASEHGLRVVRDVATVALPANASERVELSAETLQLPLGKYSMAGHITLEVLVDYDGFQDTVSAPPLFFHPEDAGFALYDMTERDARPDRGAFSEAAQAVLRTRPSAMLAPSYVESDEERAQRDDGMPVTKRDMVIPTWDEDLDVLTRTHEFLGLPPPVQLSGGKPATGGVLESKGPNVSTRICVGQRSQYTDSLNCPDGDGVCEDGYQVAAPTTRTPVGNFWEIQNSAGQTLMTGSLGDGYGGRMQGCTANAITLPSGVQHSFLIWSIGTVGGNSLASLDAWVGDDVASIATNFTLPASPPTTTNLTAIPIVFNVAQNAHLAASFAFTQNQGVVQLPAFQLMHVNDLGQTFGDGIGNEFFVDRPFATSKFVITHELGHQVHYRNAGENSNGFSFTLIDNHDTNGDGVGDGVCASLNGQRHTVSSREFSSGAHIEGFATFWSATVFNLVSTNADCWWINGNGGTWVDCAGSQTHVNQWMTSRCSPALPAGLPDRYAGMGNETDWTKQFWDVRTAGGASRPSMNAMLRWIRDANNTFNWSNTNHYQLLDIEANDTVNNGTQLNANWDVSKATNGVNH